MVDHLHSIESAAKFLGNISPWTIRAWLSDGKLVRTKAGRRTLIRESELLKVLDDGPKSRRSHEKANSDRAGRANPEP